MPVSEHECRTIEANERSWRYNTGWPSYAHTHTHTHTTWMSRVEGDKLVVAIIRSNNVIITTKAALDNGHARATIIYSTWAYSGGKLLRLQVDFRRHQPQIHTHTHTHEQHYYYVRLHVIFRHGSMCLFWSQCTGIHDWINWDTTLIRVTLLSTSCNGDYYYVNAIYSHFTALDDHVLIYNGFGTTGAARINTFVWDCWHGIQAIHS